ncbi:FAD-dependent oxidoreductase [Kaistia dalseonensis]|uniref:3-phenylpropionate/trans-cinnamate dioxygenase ferredoxin reductase subunit n=1 Tax=Kaistia dalseonensis TaxID=410840 RepID=A0ABU0H957_9HYPH|nr:3-phenylpropionate/cinnamic acid dioxygenase ferredoxin--NAD(+) reductase subunit [Kaistia dalseonensis]MCX5496232.1 FAD-dependent oxidoreductase [Kaistia dalseonensis]MDQ0438849.1 3-phenylpropionate/trans-cinnamate dioxygenase ferredoxin reductase subunit [Kaistia dalseonensis]
MTLSEHPTPIEAEPARDERSFVIIGGGQTGAVAAVALRDEGFAGRIILVGEETHLPYERPPLSKDVLIQPDKAKVTIHGADVYAARAIETRLGRRATAIDRAARIVTLDDGETLAYDRLLIATGARPRPYPLLDALGGGVFTMRTLGDAEALRAAIAPGKRLLVVGGGVIGLEVAASATVLGATVTVIERGDRLMARAAPQPLADALMLMHEARGVRFAFGAALADARRTEGGGFLLTCEDRRSFEGDLIVYGIGVTLNTEPAVAAGLAIDNGIVTDEFGRTSDPAIYAAGDVAHQWHQSLGRHIRQETWQNARVQGAAVAAAMVRDVPCAHELPWYWTDQYQSNFQVAGSPEATDWIRRGDPTAARYTLFGVTDGRIVGAVTVDNGREMRPAKELIASGRPVDLEALRDPKQDLRKLAAAVR